MGAVKYSSDANNLPRISVWLTSYKFKCSYNPHSFDNLLEHLTELNECVLLKITIL